jgi:hypothetical protein
MQFNPLLREVKWDADADAAFITFDLRQSFNDVMQQIKKCCDYVKEDCKSACQIVLVGLNSAQADILSEKELIKLKYEIAKDYNLLCLMKKEGDLIIGEDFQVTCENMPHVVLTDYINDRTHDERGLYFTFFGRFFGYSKDQKIDAAQALLDFLAGNKTPAELLPHLSALRQGRLGDKCSSTLAQLKL